MVSQGTSGIALTKGWHASRALQACKDVQGSQL